MKEEINFMFDEVWQEQAEQLNQILREAKEPEVYKNAYVLENFVRGCAYVFVRKHPAMHVKKGEIMGRELMRPKYYQKILNMPAGMEVQPIPVPSSDKYEQPIQEFKEIPIYVQKIVIEPESLKKEEVKLSNVEQTKNLIQDKITQVVLAAAKIGKEYILNEPILDDNDIQVLFKVKKKKPKDMEKGWKLIQTYGKKFGIQNGHDTLIKYYVVNSLFGLGKIEALLHDDNVKEIICEEANNNLKVNCNGNILNTNVSFDNEALTSFVYYLANLMKLKLSKKIKNAEGMLRGFKFILDLGENLDKPNFIVKKI